MKRVNQERAEPTKMRFETEKEYIEENENMW